MQSEPALAINNQISVPDVNWSERPKTLVLALQSSCSYCNQSAPFYKRLLAIAASKDIGLVAVLPGSHQANRTHLDRLGLRDLEIRTASLESIRVDGTPTVLLVNDKGEVTNYWVGRLPADKEAEVINELTS